MKGLVFKGVGNIALEEVADPVIQDQKDAIVRLTRSTICGTDLHIVRGTIPGMKPGAVLGHEGVGIVERIGQDVKNIKLGDRVIVLSTIGCGSCSYCKKKLYSQCDKANPYGPDAGVAFFGSGIFGGMQAEKVRVPYADVTLIVLPDTVTDDQAILLSDILPTAYMAVELADVRPDDTVAVFGCGPVGQLVIACLKQKKVSRIIAVDHIPYRLNIAENQGAEIINFDEQDPVVALKKATNNKGPTKIIDAVGIDAQQPKNSPHNVRDAFEQESKKVTPVTNPHNGNWIPGDAPSQVLQWAVKAVAKAGTISIIGVYTNLVTTFPIGEAMGKNLTIRMGDCNHRAYFPLLLDWIEKGQFDPLPFITKRLPFDQVIEAYKHFDKREDGWLKAVLTLDNL